MLTRATVIIWIIYKYQIIVLYTWSKYNMVCQWYLNLKNGKLDIFYDFCIFEINFVLTLVNNKHR